jgi:CRP-like cAMP-binding protein
VASFLGWAYRAGLIAATPMARVARVRRAPPAPRGIDEATVQTILAAIPTRQRRDHLLFRLLAATGLRVSEALGLSIEDIDLTPADPRLYVVGSTQQRHTVPLTDPDLLAEVRSYRADQGHAHGPLFRAQKNGCVGPLRYQSVQARWQRYCARAGVSCTLHQLRHARATVLIPARLIPVPPDPHLERTPLLASQGDAAPTVAPARPGRSQPARVDLVGCLRQSHLFRALPATALTVLAAQVRCEVHRRGELYLDPAEAFERCYLVVQGQVSFYRLAPGGRKLTMDIKRDGEVFWFASRDTSGGPRSHAEVLSDDTLLCHLALRDVRRLMVAHPPFALALFDDVYRLAVRLSDRLEELALEAVAVRLAHTLATRARENAQRIVTETHDELAWLTGASRATVTKELQRLRSRGLIAFQPHHHGIHVPDPERLLAL